MKSLTLLWREMIADAVIWCRTSTTQGDLGMSRDIQTVERRVEYEGISFLTITLPTYAEGLQKALELGRVDPSLFPGFTSGKKGLPLFLGGFLGLIFNANDGLLLDNPSTDAIHAIRQLTLTFSKINLSCTERRTRKAFERFIKNEQDVKVCDRERSTQLELEFSRMARRLWGTVFSKLDQKISFGNLVPRHGPGATADRLSGNRKYRQTEWHQRLEDVFPYLDNVLPSPSYYHLLDDVTILPPGAERPVRVIAVPKTLKTSRIIAIEPTCVQYTQQAIREAIYAEIENDPIMGHFVGFTQQEPNWLLAREGSRHGKYATLDLSDASDRVSNQLVRSMVHGWTHLHDALDSTRSRKADVPGYGILRLAKYASMGSAVCFPIEAIVFCTIVFIGISRQQCKPITDQTLQGLIGKVRIYGDDIIVPTEYVHSVIRALQDFGLVVNAHKSYWNGKFRESCGEDYYDGVSVKITKVTELLPTSRSCVKEIEATSSLRNHLYKGGYWRSAAFLDNWMSRLLRHYPSVGEESPVIGKYSFTGYDNQKMCTHLHKPLVKGYVVRTRLPRNSLDDVFALTKYFLKRGDEPSIEGHLERSGRPEAVDIKLGWGSSY